MPLVVKVVSAVRPVDCEGGIGLVDSTRGSMSGNELQHIRNTLESRAVDAGAIWRAIEHLASIKEIHRQRIRDDRHLQTAVAGLERGLRDRLDIFGRASPDEDRAPFLHLAAIEYFLRNEQRGD